RSVGCRGTASVVEIRGGPARSLTPTCPHAAKIGKTTRQNNFRADSQLLRADRRVVLSALGTWLPAKPFPPHPTPV
ncbi:hypothetical protein Ancab_019912, partial [Ancistrocladus abbreviatus]